MKINQEKKQSRASVLNERKPFVAPKLKKEGLLTTVTAGSLNLWDTK